MCISGVCVCIRVRKCVCLCLSVHDYNTDSQLQLELDWNNIIIQSISSRNTLKNIELTRIYQISYPDSNSESHLYYLFNLSITHI